MAAKGSMEELKLKIADLYKTVLAYDSKYAGLMDGKGNLTNAGVKFLVNFADIAQNGKIVMNGKTPVSHPDGKIESVESRRVFAVILNIAENYSYGLAGVYTSVMTGTPKARLQEILNHPALPAYINEVEGKVNMYVMPMNAQDKEAIIAKAQSQGITISPQVLDAAGYIPTTPAAPRIAQTIEK